MVACSCVQCGEKAQQPLVLPDRINGFLRWLCVNNGADEGGSRPLHGTFHIMADWIGVGHSELVQCGQL